MKKSKKLIANIMYPLILILAVLIIWSVAAKKAGSEFILPTFWQTFSAAKVLFLQKAFYAAFLGTLKRTLLSFLFSFTAALFFAVLSRFFESARRLCGSLISMLRALPTMSVVLLLLLWTSRETAPKIVAVMVVFPMLYAQLSAALDALDGEIFEMAKVYNIPFKTLLIKYVLPQMLPVTVTLAGAGLSLNLKLMVAAEVLAHTAQSIGYMMQMSKLYLETARLMALTVITVITGLVLEFISKLFAPLWRWKNA